MKFSFKTSVSLSYKHLAIILILQMLVLTIVRSLLIDIFKDDYFNYLLIVVLPVGGFFFVLLIRLVFNLGISDTQVKVIILMLVAGVLTRLTSVVFSTNLDVGLNLISSICILYVQVICTYYMCYNLFIDENSLIEKLWASVCVYFMIGATFGTLFSLLLFINSTGFGFLIDHPLDAYLQGIIYSLNVISGMDPIYPDAAETIKLTAVAESVFTTLFLVILIGRLLGNK